MSYNAIVLKQYPDDFINEDTFETQTFEAQPLKKGEFRVKVSHLCLDPEIRSWLDTNIKSDTPQAQLGEVMRSQGFGEVIESMNDSFPVGAHVAGWTGWTEQLVAKEGDVEMPPHGIESDQALTLFGIPGLTAFLGYDEILQAPERQRRAHQIGEKQTLLVTGAADAVGSVVVQLAIADGLKVIALVERDDQAHWLKDELDVHAVINYKTENVSTALTELAPDGIDLFFENSGGEIQHIIMEHMNTNSKVAICGLTSEYNRKVPALAPSWLHLLKRRISIEGFSSTDHIYRTPVLKAGLTPYLEKVKHRVHELEGLESAKLGINILYRGENTGKLIVKL